MCFGAGRAAGPTCGTGPSASACRPASPIPRPVTVIVAIAVTVTVTVTVVVTVITTFALRRDIYIYIYIYIYRYIYIIFYLIFQGQADVFMLLGLPFESAEARRLNRDIFETMSAAPPPPHI